MRVLAHPGSRDLGPGGRYRACMVSSSSTPTDDYAVLRTACGLLDRSPCGKLALTGDQAREFLAGQVSNDTEALVPGAGCYAALLDNKGKMQGDLRIIFTPDGGELLLLCERVALQALFDALRRSIIGWRAELHKRTVQQSLLSLIGPTAREVAGARELAMVEHASEQATLAGHDVLLVTTDTGVDLVCAADSAEAVAQTLVERGAHRIDEATAELRRVESGRPRYGVDLDTTVIPQEAALNDRAVSFTKGCYVGQETVARLFYRGKPNRRPVRPAPLGAGRGRHGVARRRNHPRRPDAVARDHHERRRLPRPRPDRTGARAARGRGGRHARRRRRDGDGDRAAVLTARGLPGGGPERYSRNTITSTISAIQRTSCTIEAMSGRPSLGPSPSPDPRARRRSCVQRRSRVPSRRSPPSRRSGRPSPGRGSGRFHGARSLPGARPPHAGPSPCGRCARRRWHAGPSRRAGPLGGRWSAGGAAQPPRAAQRSARGQRAPPRVVAGARRSRRRSRRRDGRAGPPGRPQAFEGSVRSWLGDADATGRSRGSLIVPPPSTRARRTVGDARTSTRRGRRSIASPPRPGA